MSKFNNVDSRTEDILVKMIDGESLADVRPQSRLEELLIQLNDTIRSVGGSGGGSGAKLYKLYFDGSAIFRSFADFEDYNPMTFDDIYDLCYEEENFVYIGDGQMKYYPQLDLHVGDKPESITFISTAQLDGKNMHTRIIINAEDDVRTDQIIDAPLNSINGMIDDKLSQISSDCKTVCYDVVWDYFDDDFYPAILYLDSGELVSYNDIRNDKNAGKNIVIRNGDCCYNASVITDGAYIRLIGLYHIRRSSGTTKGITFNHITIANNTAKGHIDNMEDKYVQFT